LLRDEVKSERNPLGVNTTYLILIRGRRGNLMIIRRKKALCLEGEKRGRNFPLLEAANVASQSPH